ncbi:MAG: response regulator [Desulfobacterales bacterium]|nr:response regulator [Desulfobacterales bacterium]
MNAYKKIILNIALAIGVILVCLTTHTDAADGSLPPVASDGVLDVSQWRLERDGPVRLSGQWEFYWGSLLSPEDFRSGRAHEKTGWFTMPSVWNGFSVNGRKLGGKGYATFRLKIRLDPSEGHMALLLPYAFTAYKLWIDDRLAVEVGRVGDSADTVEPLYRTRTVFIDPGDDEVDLILQISNFMHAKGGMRSPIQLVARPHAAGIKHRALIKEVLVFGCLLIMSIYHLALFAFRRQDRYNLYFALVCLLFSLRAGFTGEVFLADLFKGLDWQVSVRLEWLCVYLGGPLAVAFVQSFFPKECSGRIHRGSLVVGLILGLATLLLPPTAFTGMFPYVTPLICMMLGYSAWVMLLAALHKRSGAVMMLASLLVVMATVANDILYANDLIHTGNFIPYGMLFFVFSQAMILSTRSSQTFQRLEETNAAYALEIVDRERAEAEVREYQGRLEVLVRARTEELDAANQRLCQELDERKTAEAEKLKLQGRLQRAQKMEALGTLAGGVAHDLNNILSGLVGYPDLLLQDLPEDSLLRKPMVTIQQSGQKAAAIVQDLLNLARRGVSDLQVLNFNRIVTEYLESPEFEKMVLYHPGVQVESDLAPDLMLVKGSSVHLFKTVMNLVSNAVEAMPDGGLVRVQTENRYLDRPLGLYDAVTEGEYVVLIVTDDGIGISDDDMERIFEPFYSKKVMGKSGTGLGMAVVWGTVKDHFGYIDARSREGVGTTFTLYFPATRDELKEAPERWSMVDHRGNGETVLVVDDVAEQRDIATAMLEKLGYRADAVTSGEEAVAHVAKGPVDLLVLDMIMEPGMDGLETYMRILEMCPGQKAVIASGFAETARVRKAQGLGAGVYLKKPYRLEALAEAVRSVLHPDPT